MRKYKEPIKEPIGLWRWSFGREDLGPLDHFLLPDVRGGWHSAIGPKGAATFINTWHVTSDLYLSTCKLGMRDSIENIDQKDTPFGILPT